MSRTIADELSDKSRKLRSRLRKRFLRKIMRIKRREQHPLLRKAKERGISSGTLFYMKEYGPRSHVSRVIIKEALGILLLTSVISSLAGIGLEGIRTQFSAVIPIIILLPALNNAIGGFGTVISSKFTELVYTGRINRKEWWKSHHLRELLKFVYFVGFVSALYISALAYIGSVFVGAVVPPAVIIKLMAIALLTSAMLVGIIFVIAVYAGLKIYERNEDPNNFLIPITTAVADFSTIFVYSGLVLVLF